METIPQLLNRLAKQHLERLEAREISNKRCLENVDLDTTKLAETKTLSDVA